MSVGTSGGVQVNLKFISNLKTSLRTCCAPVKCWSCSFVVVRLGNYRCLSITFFVFLSSFLSVCCSWSYKDVVLFLCHLKSIILLLGYFGVVLFVLSSSFLLILQVLVTMVMIPELTKLFIILKHLIHKLLFMTNLISRITNFFLFIFLVVCVCMQTSARDEILANGGSLSHHHGSEYHCNVSH